MQERVWTQKYQKASDKSGLTLTEHRGLHRPAGEVPFHSMCGKCMSPWPENATRCWMCKHDQAIEYQRPTSIMDVGDQTWTLLYEAGRPVWRRAAPAQSSPGALGPEATGIPEAERHFKLSHSIDGSQFAQAPAATCTEEERTFADEVPSVCRVHIRHEIMSSDYEDDATATSAAHRKRLEEQQPAQSSRSSIQRGGQGPSHSVRGPPRALSGCPQGGARPSGGPSARRRRTIWLSCKQRSWRPFRRECRRSPPARCVDLLRKVNLLDFKAALKKRMVEETSGRTEDALQAAITSMEKAKAANKQIQDQGTAFMEQFALNPVEISAWPTELKHKLERGLFCPTASLDWHEVPDPSDMLRHYLPAMRALQDGQNPWAGHSKLLEEMPDLKHTVATAEPGAASTPGALGPAVTGPGMATLNEMDEEAKNLAMLLWALKVHRGELRMFGGVWRRVPEFSPPLPDWAQPKAGAPSAKELDKLRALERRTHPCSFGSDMVEPFHYTLTRRWKNRGARALDPDWNPSSPFGGLMTPPRTRSGAERAAPGT